jgi:hypothetical protein
MPAYFVVRAVVAESDRRDFDAWYRNEHLPDAMKAFDAQSAWRAWSRTDPSVHYAYYQFADAAAAEAIGSSPGDPHPGRRVRCPLGQACDAHTRSHRSRCLTRSPCPV